MKRLRPVFVEELGAGSTKQTAPNNFFQHSRQNTKPNSIAVHVMLVPEQVPAVKVNAMGSSQ